MAIGFVSFPVYARLLPVAEYGILNLAQKYVMFAVAVSKLGLQNAILRLHPERANSDEQLRGLYMTTSIGSLASGVVCAIVGAILCWTAQPAWLSRQIALALLIASSLIITRTGLSPIYGLLRVEGQTLLFNLLDIVTRLVALVFGVTLALLWSRSANSLLIGLCLGDLVALGIGARFMKQRGLISPTSFDPPLLRHCLAFSLPLAASELATTLLGTADRVLIQYYLGSQQLGYYAAACAMAGYLQEALQVPLNLALVPLYIKTWHTQGVEETSKLVSQTLDFFLMACGLITAVSFSSARQLIVLISSHKYEPAYPLLGPLVVGFLLYASSTFLSAGFIIQKKTALLARLVAISFVVKTALNIVMLRRWELWGAVIPSIIGFALMTGLSAWYSRQMLSIRVPVRHLLLYTGATIAATLAGNAFNSDVTLIALAGRGALTVGLYGAILWCFDSRIRSAVRQLLEMLNQRFHAA